MGRTFFEKLVLGGLGGHVDAVALDVELPAVVDAPHPALLVAAVEQGRATMGAERLKDADHPIRVAEGHVVLGEDAHLDGGRSPARAGPRTGTGGPRSGAATRPWVYRGPTRQRSSLSCSFSMACSPRSSSWRPCAPCSQAGASGAIVPYCQRVSRYCQRAKARPQPVPAGER